MQLNIQIKLDLQRRKIIEEYKEIKISGFQLNCKKICKNYINICKNYTINNRNI